MNDAPSSLQRTRATTAAVLRRLAEARASLPLVLLLTAGIRVAAGWRLAARPLADDALGYSQRAVGLLAGHGYGGIGSPSAYGAPLYPAFVAGLYALFGVRTLGVLLAQAVLDTLTCFLVYRMVASLADRRGAALIAAALYAVYPPFVLSSASVLSETLSIFLTVVTFYALGAPGRPNRAPAIVSAGAVCGLLFLARPAMLPLPLVVGAVMMWAGRRAPWVALRATALFVTCACLVVLPWTIRNARALHALLPVSSHGGLTLWAGTIATDDGVFDCGLARPILGPDDPPVDDPQAIRVSRVDLESVRRVRHALGTLGEVEADAFCRREALANISRDPVAYVRLAVPKLGRAWFNLWPGCRATTKRIGMAALNLALLVLAGLGARVRAPSGLLTGAALGIGLCVSMTSAIVLGVLRYTYPVFPFVIGLAALWIAEAPVPQAAHAGS